MGQGEQEDAMEEQSPVKGGSGFAINPSWRSGLNKFRDCTPLLTKERRARHFSE